MKIKKVNELNISINEADWASELSEEELNDIRDKRFNYNDDTEYHLWGEDLSNIEPSYKKLTTLYSIESCINWYNENLQTNEIEKLSGISRNKKYDNIILTKEVHYVKMLDFDTLITTSKFNI